MYYSEQEGKDFLIRTSVKLNEEMDGFDLVLCQEYHSVDASEYDVECCMLASEVIAFLKDTQRKQYDKVVMKYMGDEERAKSAILGCIDFKLREGILALFGEEEVECEGVSFRMVYFKSVFEGEKRYICNRLSVVRGVEYSSKRGEVVDMVLFINGIPVCLLMFRDALGGGRDSYSIRKYLQTISGKGEKLLVNGRCIACFVVGEDEIFVTTCLEGKNTVFHPFTKEEEAIGIEANFLFLWEEVLRKDSLFDIIQNYVYALPDSGRIVFPRYHQLRAIRNLLVDVSKNGVGKEYLIQHAIGSGKGNTVIWLAFQLSCLYDMHMDRGKVFDCVFIVSDREEIVQQRLQCIEIFGVKRGNIEYSSAVGSGDKLLEAVKQRKFIIVTTIQKFLTLPGAIPNASESRYAVIIDEAYRSQRGEMALHMRKALSLSEAEKFDEGQGVAEPFLGRYVFGKEECRNVSFFEFTTVPIPMKEQWGEQKPFDVYSVKDAMREGVMLDVMSNYLSFKEYFKWFQIEKSDKLEGFGKRTIDWLDHYVSLSDDALEAKSRVIIEDFVMNTASQIGGKARAILVTRSRLHVVRYKKIFDDVMREMRLPYEALAAFTGRVFDDETGETYTEESINDIQTFVLNAFKFPRFRILIVANKYLTGIDEPFLHTAYIDKPLSDMGVFQVLGRLGRVCRGKYNTRAIDFINDVEKIRQNFLSYYGDDWEKIGKKEFVTLEEIGDEEEVGGDVGGKVGGDLLSILKNLMESFGFVLTNEDEIECLKLEREVCQNGEVMKFFNGNNHKDDVQDMFYEAVDDEILELAGRKLELYNKLSDRKFNDAFKRLWFNKMYDRLVRGV